ncbi:MAG: hypothetical protein IPF72_00860 [Chitinophagaceae bacterium]|nr:hypothetical protein [Chitinophagaceae bacterium]
MVSVYSTGRDIEPGVTGKTYYDRVSELNFAEYRKERKLQAKLTQKVTLA